MHVGCASCCESGSRLVAQGHQEGQGQDDIGLGGGVTDMSQPCLGGTV